MDGLLLRSKSQNGRLSECVDNKLGALRQQLKDSERNLQLDDADQKRDLNFMNQFLYNSSVGYGDMKTAFRDADTDGNGKLSVSEVYANLKKMGLDVSPGTAIRIFSHLDINKNSEITYEEYSAAFSYYDDDDDEHFDD